MTKTLSRRRAFLAPALTLACACAHAQVGISPRFDADYALLPHGAQPGAAALVHDYGAFALWRVESAKRDGTPRMDRRIDLPSGWFTPREDDAKRSAAPKETAVYVVQFVGPAVDAWLAGLRRAGATPLQYVSHDAYLVVADAAAGAALAQTAKRGEPLRYSAPLAASNKIAPETARYVQANPDGRRRFTVVVADHAQASATQNRIVAMDATPGKRRWANLRGMWSLDVDIAASRVADIAALPDVVTIGLHSERQLFDEKQTQIIAGRLNATRTGPAAPGYREWLESLNFSTDPADYPLLAINDDGIGNGGTAGGAGDESLTRNGAGIESRVAFAVDCGGDIPESTHGHGHLMASIAAGYDDAGGFPYRDPDGYRRREGVNPWARLSNIDSFSWAVGSGCGDTEAGIIALQASQNVRVSSNSWGYIPEGGVYDVTSRAYDIGTRDALPDVDGNQPIAFVFAAGNFGPNLRTMAAPGNAKNVITVGASENQRPADEDGPWQGSERCMAGPQDADNAMDIASYSSRGPAVGGRAKPELVAPGTHVQGSASTSWWYDGFSACEKYHPDHQTELTTSMGTSLATPAVAGAATLIYRYLETSHLFAAPSPALIKSYLIAHPTYLTGLGANDTLPSPTQGYGLPNLGDAFAPDTARVLVDQMHTFGAAGETFALNGAVANDARPVRIVLSWTDAPGAVNSQSPSVNDLDLVVKVRGVTYRGNRFDGRWSVPGGTADTVNNTEAVYLPAGTNGPIEVSVTSRNVAGDGVPGNLDPTDQDFALVCSNCTQAPDFYVAAAPPAQLACQANTVTWPLDIGAIAGSAGNVALAASGTPANTSASFGQSSGAAPFASSFSLVPDPKTLAQGDYTFRIDGTDAAHTKSGTLTMRYSPTPAPMPQAALPVDGALDVDPSTPLTWSTSPEAFDYTVEIDDDPAFASIDRSATVTGGAWTVTPTLLGATRYYWRVRANNGCGASGTTAVRAFTTQAKFCVTPGARISADGVGLTMNVTLPALGTLTDLDVAFATDHSWTGDLSLRLSKGATSATLLDRPGEPVTRGGCGGIGAHLVLDDDATGTAEERCNSAGPAYVPAGGHFRPNQPLAAFNGIEAAGTYELFVFDAVTLDDGVVQSLCLLPTAQPSDPGTIYRNGFDR